MKNLFASKKNEKGQGLVEYALILVLVAVVVIVALTALGPRVEDAFAAITITLDCENADMNIAAELQGSDYDYPLALAAIDKCNGQ